MGQKTNPIGNRLGLIRGWESNWYGGDNFGEKLSEDAKIRKYLKVRLSKASVSRIAIERTLKLVTVTIHTARPGIIIGKAGQEVETLKNHGYFGKGVYDVDSETIVREGDQTSVDKPCNVLSGSTTLPLSITPMIKRLENEVQHPKTIIPEDSMSSWVRGGLPSRQIVRNLDYLRRCQEKK